MAYPASPNLALYVDERRHTAWFGLRLRSVFCAVASWGESAKSSRNRPAAIRPFVPYRALAASGRLDVLVHPEQVGRVVFGFDLGQTRIVLTIRALDTVSAFFAKEVDIGATG